MKVRFDHYRAEIWDVWVGMIRVARIWRSDMRWGHVATYAAHLDDNWTADEWFHIHDAIERKVVALDVAQRISS